jgi:hypothetical protein
MFRTGLRAWFVLTSLSPLACGGGSTPPTAGPAAPASPAADKAPRFAEAVDRIFAAAFAANPVSATTASGPI